MEYERGIADERARWEKILDDVRFGYVEAQYTMSPPGEIDPYESGAITACEEICTAYTDLYGDTTSHVAGANTTVPESS